MRLIDADALIQSMLVFYGDYSGRLCRELETIIDNEPTIDAVIINNKKTQQPKIGDAVFVRGRIDEIRRDTVIIRNDGGYFGTDYSEVVKFFVEDDVLYGVQLFRQDGERSE